jgi:uncharacterized membrane protein YfcA
MIVVGLLLAVVVGISLGLLGGGGSILAVPIFVYVLGFETKEAVAMSLAVVGVTSLVAATGHWRAGRVDWRIAGIFGSVAMGGTYLGARLAVFFSGSAQLLVFAAIMLVAAYFMYRERNPLLDRRGHGSDGGKMPIALIVVEGLVVGVITGLVGVGGGFLVVPALVLLGGIGMKEAVGTSLVVISMKSAAGLAGYLGQVEIPWGFVASFGGAAILGSFVGSYAIRFVPYRTLEKAFALFLVAMGAWILYQNSGAIF